MRKKELGGGADPISLENIVLVDAVETSVHDSEKCHCCHLQVRYLNFDFHILS